MSENTEKSAPANPEPKPLPKFVSRFPKGMKFHRVIFNGRSDPNEVPYVPLSVNGLQIHLTREKEVILPDNFLEAADNASYDNLVAGVTKDNRPTVIKDGIILRFPYRVVKDDSREEPTELDFFNMLNEGNEITDAVLQRNNSSQGS